MTVPESVVTTAYAPGDWMAIVGNGIWLLADCAPSAGLVTDLWTRIVDGAEADTLPATLSAGGTGSGWALVAWTGDSIRTVASGTARIELLDASGLIGTTDVTAGERSVDTRITSITEVRLCGPASVDGSSAAPLPIRVGATPASLIVILTPVVDVPILDPPQVEPDPPVAESGPSEPVVVPNQPVPSPEPSLSLADLLADPSAAPRSAGYVSLFQPPAAAPVDVPSMPIAPPVPLSPPAPPEPVAPPVYLPPEQPVYLPPAPPVYTPPTPPVYVPPVRPILHDEGPISDVSWAEPTAAGSRQPHVAPQPRHVAPASGYPAVEVPYVAEKPDEMQQTLLKPRTVAGPMIPALRCVAGHLNPMLATACRVCGRPVPQKEPEFVVQPPLGALRLANGDPIRLERGVVMGRAPGPPGTDPGSPSHIVLQGADVSRRHVEVILDGWEVFLVDLGSANGTIVTPPDGGVPETLVPHARHRLRPGSSVSLSDEISFRYEVTE